MFKNKFQIKHIAYKGKEKLYEIIGFVVFSLLVILLLYPALFFNFSSKIPFGGHKDVLNIISIINHNISTSINNLYNLPILYPFDYTITYTHHLFGISLYFFIFKLFGFTLIQSYNLYLIFCLFIGSFGTYLLIREFVSNRIVSAFLSLTFILQPFRFSYLHWLNFQSYFYVPIVFYFLLKYLKSKKYKFIILASLFAFMQFVSSPYIGTQIYYFLIPFFMFFY